MTNASDGPRRSDRALIARIAAGERWGRAADRAAPTEPAAREWKRSSSAREIRTALFHRRSERWADQLMRSKPSVGRDRNLLALP